MGQVQVKDVEVRHYETMLGSSKGLVTDQYAKSMYEGGLVFEVMNYLCPDGAHHFCSFGDIEKSLPGYLEMVAIRTKWIDDAVMSCIMEHSKTTPIQLVILQARQDTRAFRLPIGQHCTVYEIDKRDAQQEKLDGLLYLEDKYYEQAAKRVKRGQIHFVSCDVPDGLIKAEGYSRKKPTVVLLEGLTQYVDKEVTVEQLRKMYNSMPKGSKIIMTYADKNCFDDPSKVGRKSVVKKIMEISSDREGGEWITAWTKDEMNAFLKSLGYVVEWDTNARECHDMYLWRLGRELDDDLMLCMERFVIARKA